MRTVKVTFTVKGIFAPFTETITVNDGYTDVDIRVALDKIMTDEGLLVDGKPPVINNTPLIIEV